MELNNYYNATPQIDRSADFNRIRFNVNQNLITADDKVTIGGGCQDLQLIPSRLPDSGKSGKPVETGKAVSGSKLKDFIHSKGMKAVLLGTLACSSLIGTVSSVTSYTAVEAPVNQTQTVQTVNKQELQELNLHLFGSTANNNILDRFTFDFQTAVQQPPTGIPDLMIHKDVISQPAAKEKENDISEVRRKILSPKAEQYDKIIEEAAEKYNIDADFIRCMIQQESQFNSKAKSGVGAAGMMQLMPGTAKSLGVTNRLDPRDNIMGGAKYIKQLLDKYKGNKELALAAYNAGPTAVAKYGKVPPFKETQKYVKNIMSMYSQLSEV